MEKSVAILQRAEMKTAYDGKQYPNGLLTGYATVWNALDNGAVDAQGKQYADIIPRGAIDGAACEKFVKDGFNPVSHDWSFDGIKAMPVFATEDDYGLQIGMAFHSTEDAQSVRVKCQERIDAGKSVALSIGWNAKRGGVTVARGEKSVADCIAQNVATVHMADAQAKADKLDYVRVLKSISLDEVSIVAKGMEPRALATGVKNATNDNAMPIAPRETRWNAKQAEERIRKATGADDEPTADYGKCFVSVGSDAASFDSYKGLVCDVVDGEIKIVPKAVFALAAKGADENLVPLYKRMATEFADEAIVAPWEKKSRVVFSAKAVFEEVEAKGAFEDAFEEQTESQWFLWQVFMNACYQIDCMEDAMERAAIPFDANAAYSEAVDEFAARLKDALTNPEEAGEEDMSGENGARGPAEKHARFGASLGEQIGGVGATVKMLTARATATHEMRVKEGRRFSAATTAKIRAAYKELGDLVAAMESETEQPKQEEPKPETQKSVAHLPTVSEVQALMSKAGIRFH